MTRVAWLGVLLLVRPACADQGVAAVALGSSAQSGWSAPGRTEYRDSASWDAAWTQMFPIAAFRPALPAIDFGHARVVIVAAGTKSSGGYLLRLDSNQVRQDTSVVFVTLQTPAPGCGVTQELTTPALAIALPARPIMDRIVTHQRADTTRCP